MNYSHFGLDEEKKEKDADGRAGHLYCMFCQRDNIRVGFSLCFSNFCICQQCLDTATNIENIERWVDSKKDKCFKCHKADVIGFIEPINEIPICKDCIDWGKKVLYNVNGKL